MAGVESRSKPKGSREAALLGQVVDGRYELREVIARGAMGAVYLARQMPLDRPVALKVLDPVSVVGDFSVFEERFLREASTLARLQHPNTVRVFDYGSWEGRAFLVMEYVDGYSLRRLFAGGPMPPGRMIKIGMQLCGALYEAHSLGLIHRDLKPANVLLTRHPGALDVVKVVDFGLAKGFHSGDADLTQAGQVMGTPMFMAPEQIRDEACDPRVDIYALGVLFFRGLTGHTPVPKGKTMAVLMANLHDPPRSFAAVNPDLDLPPVLEWVIMRCLEKEPEARFANVMELRKGLKACMLALEDPNMRDLAIDIDEGMAVLPDDYTESSIGTGRLPRMVTSTMPYDASGDLGLEDTMPEPAPELRPPGLPLGAVPQHLPLWGVALGMFVMMTLGVVAGVVAERILPAPSSMSASSGIYTP